MAYLLIDNQTSALAYSQNVTLEGVEYLFDFTWDAREACWYLTISDQDENLIAAGIKLVVNWRLLRRFRDPRLPAGLLFCADLTGQGQDIAAAADLGSRVELWYITSDDPDLPLVGLPT